MNSCEHGLASGSMGIRGMKRPQQAPSSAFTVRCISSGDRVECYRPTYLLRRTRSGVRRPLIFGKKWGSFGNFGCHGQWISQFCRTVDIVNEIAENREDLGLNTSYDNVWYRSRKDGSDSPQTGKLELTMKLPVTFRG